MTGFEILEHTADVGVRARGASVEAAFEQATRGLLDITGATAPGPGERVTIEVGAHDIGGVLVDWLEEVLYLQDAGDAVITDLAVESVGEKFARGWVEIVPRGKELEGTAVKAITYHQLGVSQQPDGTWEAVVYFDI